MFINGSPSALSYVIPANQGECVDAFTSLRCWRATKWPWASFHSLPAAESRQLRGVAHQNGHRGGEKWHLETKYRWVNQYKFYL